MEKLVEKSGSDEYALSEKDLSDLTAAGVIPANTPKAQADIFRRICLQLGLSPFTREIYLLNHMTKAGLVYTPIVGIGGFRKIAAETGELAGVDETRFDLLSDGSFKTAAELIAAKKVPTTATVTVYRAKAGLRCPFTHTAVFSEFAGRNPMYGTMPFQMIGKVAESFALRKAFGDRMQGLFDETEVPALSGDTLSEVAAMPLMAQKAAEKPKSPEHLAADAWAETLKIIDGDAETGQAAVQAFWDWRATEETPPAPIDLMGHALNRRLAAAGLVFDKGTSSVIAARQ